MGKIIQNHNHVIHVTLAHRDNSIPTKIPIEFETYL